MSRNKMKTSFLITVFVGLLFAMPDGMVDIQTINPSIKVKLMYSTEDNFLGEDVYGDLEKCYLRKEAAIKLSKAQEILQEKKKGYSLLVYDGLRPRDVQAKMWETVKGTDKQKYVANPRTGSIHNYGAAVDLTILDSLGKPLDMGTHFDYFGELAQPRYEEKFLAEGKLTEEQVENRKLLREVMTSAGFQGISVEWWHFDAFPKNEVRERYSIVESMKGEKEKSSVSVPDDTTN
ncbi:MAG: M15 family metallopeptidase [Chitinispirillaceae bacterium]